MSEMIDFDQMVKEPVVVWMVDSHPEASPDEPGLDEVGKRGMILGVEEEIKFLFPDSPEVR